MPRLIVPLLMTLTCASEPAIHMPLLLRVLGVKQMPLLQVWPPLVKILPIMVPMMLVPSMLPELLATATCPPPVTVIAVPLRPLAVVIVAQSFVTQAVGLFAGVSIQTPAAPDPVPPDTVVPRLP